MLGSIGGDAVKCLLAARFTKLHRLCILSVFVDRLVDLTMFVSALILFWNNEIEQAVLSRIQGTDVRQIATAIALAVAITLMGLA